MRKPWFRHHSYFGYWPINRSGWIFNALLWAATSVFLLICIYLTSVATWLAIPLVSLFAIAAFRLTAIVDNRTRKD
nr:hypothetical protein [uncultured Brevundimonas sp.]